MKKLYNKENKIKKDIKRRLLFKEYESFNNIYALIKNLNFLTKNNDKYSEKYINDKVTVIKNHCIISGNRHSVHSKYRLHRSFLRSEILNGNMPGFKKSLW